MKYAVIIMLSEMVIDCIKHFFITRINKLRTDLYIDFKTLIFRNYLTKSCNIAPELQNEMFVEIEDEQGVKTV